MLLMQHAGITVCAKHLRLFLCMSYLVSIPAQLPDVLQELVSTHVGGVQAGFMLPGHLGGAGRGLLTPSIICTDNNSVVLLEVATDETSSIS